MSAGVSNAGTAGGECQRARGCGGDDTVDALNRAN
jgi:hypothetical protein